MMHSVICLTVFALLMPEYPAQLFSVDGNVDANTVNSPAKAAKSDLRCPPAASIPFEFFPLPCSAPQDCGLMGPTFLCCKSESQGKRCTKGVKREKKQNVKKQKDLENTGQVFLQLLPIVTTAAAPTSTTKATTTTTTTRKTTTAAATTTTLKPTTTTQKPTTAKPSPKTTKAAKAKKAANSDDIVCPKQQPFQFFAVRCVKKHSECKKSLGQDFLCCNQVCVRGMEAPLSEQTHQPILGLIPRDCPSEPFGELLFETQSCETDAECWPRICCPDGNKRYCKTAMARLDLVPATKRFNGPLSNMASYVQCSPPPPKGLDLFPRPCSNTLDCFPNLCCQEGGNKFCRPAKKSIVAFIAGRVGSGLNGFQQNLLKRET